MPGFSRRPFLRQPYDGVIMTVCAAHVQPQRIMPKIRLMWWSGGQEHEDGAPRDGPYV